MPLWVDAAQALGHVDTAYGADVIYATSRKWLAGPRGVGVLGVAEAWWDRLRIPASALALSGVPADRDPIVLLESGEANIAGRVGLCNAVREFIQDEPERVWQRLAQVGVMTREALADLPGWQPLGPVDGGSAITGVRATNGQEHRRHQDQAARRYGIVTTAGGIGRAPREMTTPLLRISPHVDCAPGDLAVLRNALLAIG